MIRWGNNERIGEAYGGGVPHAMESSSKGKTSVS